MATVFANWETSREFDFALSVVRNDLQTDTVTDVSGSNLALEDILQTSTVDGTVYLLTRGGLLRKHTAETGWVTLHYDVVKYTFDSKSDLWTVHQDGWSKENGADRWSRTKDIAFTADGKFYWQSDYGLLQVKHSPDSGFVNLASDVVKIQVQTNSDLWILHEDGWSRVNGTDKWAKTKYL